ncbi:MAG: SPOR domain-containing protein, partial [bacterium]
GQLVTGELERPDSALAATRGDRRWSIQVGAFSEEASASRLAEGLRARYPVAILPGRKDGERWRVRIQPIEDEDRARAMADRLKRDEHLPTWVTPMEGRAGS